MIIHDASRTKKVWHRYVSTIGRLHCQIVIIKPHFMPSFVCTGAIMGATMQQSLVAPETGPVTHVVLCLRDMHVVDVARTRIRFYDCYHHTIGIVLATPFHLDLANK